MRPAVIGRGQPVNQTQEHPTLGISWTALRPKQSRHSDPNQPMKNVIAQHVPKVQGRSTLHENRRKDFVHGLQGFVNVC